MKFVDAGIERIPEISFFDESLDDLLSLYQSGMPAGDSTGWKSVDKHFTVIPGQLTIVTGWPGSGKGEFTDAMCIHLAKQGWKTVFYSPESSPTHFHQSKLMQKWTGKPFGAGPTDRMTKEEVHDAMLEMNRHFGFVSVSTECDIPAVLNASAPWFEANADKRILVIDPWNQLAHDFNGLSETQFVSKSLMQINLWAKDNNVHVFLIAHPQKMRNPDGTLPVARPDMIAGSQHFWNKADNCLSIWRQPDSTEVDIHVQKVRWAHLGQVGMVTLTYDRVTGRYHEKLTSVGDLKYA